VTFPKITVTMPAFNAARYIESSIRSVLRQDCDDFELLIMDDASSDGTLHIAERFKTDLRVRILKNKGDRGVAANRNRLLALARGQYLVQHDADDIMLQGRLREQLEILENHPTVGLVFGRVLVYDESRRRALGFIQPLNREGIPLKYSEIVSSLPPRFHLSSAMIRKRQIEDAGGYQPFVDLDTDSRLSRRLFEKISFYFLNRLALVYRIHGESHCQRVLRERKSQVKKAFAFKNGSRGERPFSLQIGDQDLLVRPASSKTAQTIRWRLNFYLNNPGRAGHHGQRKLLITEPSLCREGKSPRSDVRFFRDGFLKPLSTKLNQRQETIFRGGLVSKNGQGILLCARNELELGKAALAFLKQDFCYHSSICPILFLRKGKIFGQSLITPLVLEDSLNPGVKRQELKPWGEFWNPLIKRYCLNVDLYRDYLIGDECLIQHVLYLDINPRNQRLAFRELDPSALYLLLRSDPYLKIHLSSGHKVDLAKTLAFQAKGSLAKVPDRALDRLPVQILNRIKLDHA